MPTMEIDGKKVAWEGKKMILQVALDNNIEIPHYCYHPGLSIVASCRICLGEIESPDPKDPANPGFAAFGHVVAGMDVVKSILGMPTDPTKGIGAMKGEMLLKPVKILTVRRVAADAGA